MPDEITRIEFEPLGDGRFFWRLFTGDRLTHEELSQPDTLAAMLETTRLFCTAIQPAPGENHAQEAPRAAEEN